MESKFFKFIYKIVTGCKTALFEVIFKNCGGDLWRGSRGGVERVCRECGGGMEGVVSHSISFLPVFTVLLIL